MAIPAVARVVISQGLTTSITEEESVEGQAMTITIITITMTITTITTITTTITITIIRKITILITPITTITQGVTITGEGAKAIAQEQEAITTTREAVIVGAGPAIAEVTTEGVAVVAGEVVVVAVVIDLLISH